MRCRYSSSRGVSYLARVLIQQHANGTGIGCRSSSVGNQEIQIAAIGKLKIAPWSDEYLIPSEKELNSRPCEWTIWKSTSYGLAIVKAHVCIDCQSMAIDSMNRFCTVYIIGQVEKVLAMVSSILKYSLLIRSPPYCFCR
jgi:hypothetical protein